MTVLARTITGETKAEVEAKVKAALQEGWRPVGNVGRLYVGGKQEEGRAKWCQQLVKEV